MVTKLDYMSHVMVSVLLEFSKIVFVFDIQALATLGWHTTTHCIHFTVLTLFKDCGLIMNAFVVFIVSKPAGCSSLFEASETV